MHRRSFGPQSKRLSSTTIKCLANRSYCSIGCWKRICMCVSRYWYRYCCFWCGEYRAYEIITVYSFFYLTRILDITPPLFLLPILLLPYSDYFVVWSWAFGNHNSLFTLISHTDPWFRPFLLPILLLTYSDLLHRLVLNIWKSLLPMLKGWPNVAQVTVVFLSAQFPQKSWGITVQDPTMYCLRVVRHDIPEGCPCLLFFVFVHGWILPIRYVLLLWSHSINIPYYRWDIFLQLIQT